MSRRNDAFERRRRRVVNAAQTLHLSQSALDTPQPLYLSQPVDASYVSHSEEDEEELQRSSSSSSESAQQDVKEEDLSFVKINFDLLFDYLRKNRKASLFCFSKIRKSFDLDLSCFPIQRGDRAKFCLVAKVADFFTLARTYFSEWEETKNLIRKVVKLIWFAHKCIHCNVIIFEEDKNICQVCDNLSICTYLDNECIICSENIHPISFRCDTCVDSQFCISCETKRSESGEKNANCCTICKKPAGSLKLRASEHLI